MARSVHAEVALLLSGAEGKGEDGLRAPSCGGECGGVTEPMATLELKICVWATEDFTEEGGAVGAEFLPVGGRGEEDAAGEWPPG